MTIATTAITPTRDDRSALHPWSIARPATDPAVSFGDVIDLLNACGPLPVHDIAGALDVPECAAAGTVRQMIARRCLRSDEWRRYRLSGACAE